MAGESRKKKLLKHVGSELQKCAKCGACLSVCPVFSVAPREKFSPRGKIALCEAAVENDSIVTDEFRDIIANCLQCGACSEECSSGVAFDKIIRAARNELSADSGVPAKKSGSSVENDGQGHIPEIGGLVHRVPPAILEERCSPPDLSFIRQALDVPMVPNAVDTVTLFAGCMINYIYPEIGRTAVKVLNTMGVDVFVPKDQTCCGASYLAAGDYRMVKRSAEENIKALFAADGRDHIITLCASGGYMLKRVYGDLFPKTEALNFKAKELMSRTLDISEYLVRVVGLETVSRHIKRKTPGRITYHAPCYLNRGQNVQNEPKALLKLACGKQVVEMPEEGMCCGAGVGYNLTHPDFSDKILSRKIDHILISEAVEVATSCPGCIMQLSRGFRDRRKKVNVLHTVEVLARSMGID